MSDGNEATDPDDRPGLGRALRLAAGTAVPAGPRHRRRDHDEILPGSANLFGGRGVTCRASPGGACRGWTSPTRRTGSKMACGENPKRDHGSRGAPRHPHGQCRPATARLDQRRANTAPTADEYGRKRQAGEDEADQPNRDLQLETLAGVLQRRDPGPEPCYGPTRWLPMIDIAKEFGYKVTAFHHAVEAYKIADAAGRQRHLRRHVDQLVGRSRWRPRRRQRERRPDQEAGGCASYPLRSTPN